MFRNAAERVPGTIGWYDELGIYMMKQAENFLDEYQGYANGRKEKNLE